LGLFVRRLEYPDLAFAIASPGLGGTDPLLSGLVTAIPSSETTISINGYTRKLKNPHLRLGNATPRSRNRIKELSVKNQGFFRTAKLFSLVAVLYFQIDC
jgi:hypothetical protein